MQFRFTKFASALIASGIISLPVTASANDSSELEELRGLVQELSQQVKVLQRKGELNDEEVAAAKKDAPVVSASERGFSIKSADGNNELRFRGQIQTDARFYPGHVRNARYCRYRYALHTAMPHPSQRHRQCCRYLLRT